MTIQSCHAEHDLRKLVFAIVIEYDGNKPALMIGAIAMFCRSFIVIGTLVFFANPATVFAGPPTRIQVRVIDQQGVPVEGAFLQARYLATIPQDGKDFHVPLELADSQTTDSNGRCEMSLRDASWTIAGLSAHRPELTTDEVVKLHEDAPADPQRREEIEREIEDRSARYSVAYQLLTPETQDGALITLQMVPAVKVTGRLRVSGQPIAKAFVTIYSEESPIDQLFARWTTHQTDVEGRFCEYSVLGDLDRVRIDVERASGKWVLELRDVQSKRTSNGLDFELDTERKDYTLITTK